MRIVHLLPQFHISNRRLVIGGYASSVMTLAEAQINAGNKVTIAARLPETYDYEGSVKFHALDILDNSSHRAPHIFAARAVDFVRENTEQDDVIHFHTGHAEYALVSAWLRKRTRRRVFHTIYCPTVQGARGGMQRAATMSAYKCGVRFSGMSRNVTASLPIKAQWTPPIIDSNYYHAAVPTESRTGIAFVGNATESKGLTDLLSAYSKMQSDFLPFTPEPLTITTELPRTSASAELASALRVLQASDELSINWLSIVPDMRHLLDQHSIHVAPFRHTNGPSDYFISTLEAMSLGLTCVITNLAGMSEIVTDGINGFVCEEGNASDLRKTILRALNSDRSMIGSAARGTIQEMFGSETLNKTTYFYERD